MKLNATLIGSTVVAALGGLLFGFDTVIISGAQTQLKEIFQLDGFMQGFMVASALIGTIIGSLIAGKPGDVFGRRDSLKVVGLVYLVSALGCALAWSFTSLVTFRLVGGIAIGASSVLGPLYLVEIAPTRLRGRLVGFFQFNVILGILLAYVANYALGLFQLGAAEWRWKLGIVALPAAAFMFCLFFIPRSPRWLAMKGLYGEARTVLERIGTEQIDDRLEAIRRSIHVEQGRAAEPLFRRAYLVPILLAWGVAMFNQLTGINALLYYLNPIFTMAGFNKVSGDMQSVAVGATMLIFTLFGMLIIDHVGRRKLLLAGSVGMAIALGGVAAIFNTGEHKGLLIWLLLFYMVFFSFGQGAVIWVYISEVFPNAVRGKGQTLGSFTHWFMAAVVSWTFPVFARNAGEPGAGIPFVFFAAMMVLQFFVVWKFFPETKGIALEDMEEAMSGKGVQPAGKPALALNPNEAVANP
jgi:MFS transporter, SP family, arabinose:H+ symporter